MLNLTVGTLWLKGWKSREQARLRKYNHGRLKTRRPPQKPLRPRALLMILREKGRDRALKMTEVEFHTIIDGWMRSRNGT